MEELWRRIENWLGRNAPDVLKTLQTGAAADEIKQTEKLLGITFPPDVSESYLIHNGQTSAGIGFIEGWGFLSLESIRKEWSVWKELLECGAFDDFKSEPLGPIAPDWWNPRWIPLTANGGGDHHCLDLAPATGGNAGQIIMMWHDTAEREVVASSFRAWWERFGADLEEGEYVLAEEYDGLVSRYDV